MFVEKVSWQKVILLFMHTHFMRSPQYDVYGEGLLTKNYMSDHANSFHEDWHPHCNICGQCFLTKVNMIIHVQTHFLKIGTLTAIFVDNVSWQKLTWSFMCYVCGEGFLAKGDKYFQNSPKMFHIKSSLKILSNTIFSKIYKYTCIHMDIISQNIE